LWKASEGELALLGRRDGDDAIGRVVELARVVGRSGGRAGSRSRALPRPLARASCPAFLPFRRISKLPLAPRRQAEAQEPLVRRCRRPGCTARRVVADDEDDDADAVLRHHRHLGVEAVDVAPWYASRCRGTRAVTARPRRPG